MLSGNVSKENLQHGNYQTDAKESSRLGVLYTRLVALVFAESSETVERYRSIRILVDGATVLDSIGTQAEISEALNFTTTYTKQHQNSALEP